ncbi:hypothetical protein Lal_00025896, partial [Lupinus albus]
SKIFFTKTTAKRIRIIEFGGSSTIRSGRTTTRSDPYYSPALQAEREFYSNFQFKDDAYVSLVKGKLFTLDEDLVLQVGGLTIDGSPLDDCNDELWNSY